MYTELKGANSDRLVHIASTKSLVVSSTWFKHPHHHFVIMAHQKPYRKHVLTAPVGLLRDRLLRLNRQRTSVGSCNVSYLLTSTYKDKTRFQPTLFLKTRQGENYSAKTILHELRNGFDNFPENERRNLKDATTKTSRYALLTSELCH